MPVEESRVRPNKTHRKIEAPRERERTRSALPVGWLPGWLLLGLLWAWVLLLAGPVQAQESGELVLRPAPELGAFVGRPLDSVQVETLGDLWPERLSVQQVRPGEIVSTELVRRALRELSETGRFADLEAELLEEQGRVILALWVRPRRLIADVRIQGSPLEEGEAFRALELGKQAEVTESILERATERVRLAHVRAGFPDARVSFQVRDTDDPKRVMLYVQVEPGAPQLIRELRILVRPSPAHPRLHPVLDEFPVRAGHRQDEARLKLAVEELTQALILAGFYEAEVELDFPARDVVELRLHAGPHFSFRMEGNATFDTEELLAELDLSRLRDPSPELLAPVLKKFYVRQGFLDSTVRFLRFDSKDGRASELYAWIREGKRFQVEKRLYPCLSGARSEQELESEVNGVLAEQFPEVTLFAPVHPDAMEKAATGRVTPGGPPLWEPAPYESYSDAAYQAVRSHLENLYRAEGYLDAQVGPVTLVRRACSRFSQPNECIVSGPPPLPVLDCQQPVAEEETDAVLQTCVPDPSRGIRCEPSGVLVLPVRAGRQAILYDLKIEGNERFTEKEILETLALPLGQPIRREEVESGLRRVKELYAEAAHAFFEIESEVVLSPDRTRARLIVSMTERQQVQIRRIDVRGAERTRESLIRSRLALQVGELFRQSAAERSQRQIESLGVFTSVSIGLEDPGVPARDKVLVVTVSERLSQYLDVKGGFATGEGFRIGFEYGHRNLGGEAIQLTVRSQLGIRPPVLIAEEDVRLKYEQLNLGELLERRNTVTLAFPETGLGPLFRLEVEGLDAHTNQRDFAQTRDAGIVRLIFRPHRQYWFQTGATVELNNARIFFAEDESKSSLEEYVQANPEFSRMIRVPEGQSVAITQNISGTWDRRDRSLAARRGTFLSVGLEHVSATPTDERAGRCDETATGPFDAACSEFLRYTGRVAAYVPLNKKGLTWAMSLRGGVIQHLTADSRTYPDRLFFMGGIDTIRSYPQDSLVPQDVAEELLNPESDLTIEQVALRGGDFFFNPRFELRIPLFGNLHTALFLDTGNLWADPSRINLLQLRYALGTGLRIETPVGPLVFDYGFNVDRVLDQLFPRRAMKRSWEPLGAFHFSIGLF